MPSRLASDSRLPPTNSMARSMSAPARVAVPRVRSRAVRFARPGASSGSKALPARRYARTATMGTAGRSATSSTIPFGRTSRRASGAAAGAPGRTSRRGRRASRRTVLIGAMIYPRVSPRVRTFTLSASCNWPGCHVTRSGRSDAAPAGTTAARARGWSVVPVTGGAPTAQGSGAPRAGRARASGLRDQDADVLAAVGEVGRRRPPELLGRDRPDLRDELVLQPETSRQLEAGQQGGPAVHRVLLEDEARLDLVLRPCQLLLRDRLRLQTRQLAE